MKTETQSIIVSIATLRGRFRVNLAGADEDLKAVGPALDRLAAESESPEDFLVKADPELSDHNIIIADLFDVGSRTPQLSIVQRIRMLMNSKVGRNATAAYPHLLATFQMAHPEEVSDLPGNSADLTLVENYVNSVLADLGEERVAASTELRAALGEAAYVILGSDDE